MIRTTGEHPFWVQQEQGWVAAKDLRPGDRLSGHDGRWTAVEAVTDAGEWTTVYNFAVGTLG